MTVLFLITQLVVVVFVTLLWHACADWRARRAARLEHTGHTTPDPAPDPPARAVNNHLRVMLAARDDEIARLRIELAEARRDVQTARRVRFMILDKVRALPEISTSSSRVLPAPQHRVRA